MQKWIPSAALGLMFAGSVAMVHAAASDVTIPTGESQTSWLHAWGGAFQSMGYDVAKDAFQVQAAWTGAETDAADNYIVGTVAGCNGWIGCGSGIDGSLYDSIELDILWDKDNTVNAGLQIGFDHGYAGTYLTNWYSPPMDGEWHHLSIAIPGTATGVGNFMGVGIYIWQPLGTSGTMNYWVKDVVVKAKIVPIPPPTLVTPEKVHATGLWLGMATGGGGNRNSVYTTVGEGGGNGVSWVGVATPATPVTYSMNIAQYPDSSKYPDIQSHIMLSSDAANGGGAADWNSTNGIFFRIMNRVDGSAYAAFMFKTNADHSYGGQIYGIGTLANIDSTTVTGTWSITFTSDTDVAVTTPDNTTTNFAFPADAVPYFQHVYASYGIQQNNDTYGGRYVILSHVGISSPYSIDDSFTDPLPDASLSIAGPLYGAQRVPPGSVLYAKWLLPASGYNVRLSSDLTKWADAAPTNTWDFDAFGWLPLTQSDLSGTTMNFFGMVKRVATQLQVLLPGETNAPGTVSGKVGTPDPQTAGNFLDVRINACDANWNIARTCKDTVAITSSDSSAGLPPDTALVKGTATISGLFYFGSSGTWTVTATDVTTNTVSSGTSSPITLP